MTSQNKGSHGNDRLTWMWSRNECAKNHHVTEGRRPEAAPATPPHHTQTHSGSHPSEEAARQQWRLDPTPSGDTQGRQIYLVFSFCCGLCRSAARARPYSLTQAAPRRTSFLPT